MSIAQTIKKQPDETLNISIDFSAVLGTGETVTGTPTATSTSGLTVSNVAIGSDSESVDMTIAGGTDGNSYIITVSFTSSASEVIEGEILVIVRELLWQTSALIILRTLINDWGATPTYTDDRLLDIFMAAAFQVDQEVSLANTYTINITNGTISPDPSAESAFIHLATLKAACIIDRGNLRAAALTDGLSARCGPVQMQAMGRMAGFKILMESGWCAAYDHSKMEYQFNKSITLVKAIMSPFVNDNNLGIFDYYGNHSDEPRVHY